MPDLIVSSMAGARAMLGDRRYEDAVRAALKYCGADDYGCIWWDGWSYDDHPISARLIQRWIDGDRWHSPALDDMRRNVELGAHPLDALKYSLMNFAEDDIIGSAWWGEVVDYEFSYLADKVEDEITQALAELAGTSEVESDLEVSDILDTCMAEFDLSMIPNVGLFIGEEVCCNIYLATPAEREADCSHLGSIARALANHEDIHPNWTDNALCWLAEQRGAPRLQAIVAEKGDACEDLAEEVRNASWGMGCLTVLVRCSLMDYLGMLAAANTRQGCIELPDGACGLIHDRWYGADSAVMGINVPEGLKIPSEMIFDVALDVGPWSQYGSRGDKAMLVSRLSGWPLRESGVDLDEAWPRVPIVAHVNAEEPSADDKGLEQELVDALAMAGDREAEERERDQR